jgi:uncharacterized protein YbjT (DUF2867 family)
VVKELLARPASEVGAVRALVRDGGKASETLPADERLEVVNVDLADVQAAEEACSGASYIIWCAQGDGRAAGGVEKAKGVFGTLVRALKLRLGVKEEPTAPKEPAAGAALEQPKEPTALDVAAKAAEASGGRLVFLSSASVTRPAWSAAKREAYEAVADIPIVRLNPFGVLDLTRLAEQRVREAGCEYVIVRPVGLRDTTGAKSWPRGRPVLSQHDVLVGRANREDVAYTLVEAAQVPDAEGKTLEMLTLASDAYPAPVDGLPFGLLLTDKQRVAMNEDVGFGAAPEGSAGEAATRAAFLAAQQLLPGEVQDATRLEMGRTYEQLDDGKVDRKKGTAPTERELALANRAQG